MDVNNMVNVESSDRGLAPHKSMPMLDVHPSFHPTRSGLRPPRAGELNRWALAATIKVNRHSRSDLCNLMLS